MPYDPLDPLTWLPTPGVPPPLPQGPQPFRPKPLDPQEESGLLSKIGGAALGGLGYAGSVLEKTFGGRAIRGALGGKPRELLSVIPGSDTLGITDEADRVSGKELLGLGKDEGWGSTLAGMGAEMALDPGMYLTFGGAALSRGGQVARKVGILPKTASGRVGTTLGEALAAAAPEARGAAQLAAGGTAEHLAPLLSQHLGGVAGLGLPFAHPTFLLGTGQGGLDFLSRLGRAGSLIDQGVRKLPVARHLYETAAKGLDLSKRHLTSWLDPEVLGATSHEGQAAAREAMSTRRTLLSEDKGRLVDYARELEAGGSSPTGSTLREVGEGFAPTGGPARQADMSVAGKMHADYEARLQALQKLGVDVQPLRDEMTQFMSRQATPLARPTSGYSRPTQPLTARDPRVEAREEILKNIPGGTESINRLVLDPELHQGSALEGAAAVQRKYLGGGGVGDQATRLADWARSLDPQYRASAGTDNPLRYFGNHPLQDYGTYHERTGKLLGAAGAAHNLLAGKAVDTAALAAGQALAEPHVGVLQALERAGLGFNAPGGVGGQASLLAKMNEARAASGLPALRSAEEANALSAAQNQARAAQGLPPLPALQGDLARFAVPESTVGELTRYMRGFSAPESLNPLLRAYDYITNLTKLGQTALFPGFHVRNLVSGLWQNMVKGGFEPGLDPVSGFLKPIMDARRLQGGEVLQDANAIRDLIHLTPEQASAQLGKEMFAQGIGGHAPSLGRDVTGPGGEVTRLAPTLSEMLSQVPGEAPQTLGGALGKLGTRDPAAWNPLNVAGVGAGRDVFAPAQAGRAVGDVVEGVNRGSLYLALRRQGYTPEQAGREVLHAHFDYSRGANSEVESKLLKRVIPFYRYTRENIPFQLEQLATRPGGLAATEARVAHDLRQQGGFLPDYLGSGLAVPVGEEHGGTQRYLTRLDLPPEQAFEMLRGGPNWLGKSFMGLLGQTNPLLKGPLEYATGKQFFTGRDLEDLHSRTDSTLLDQVLANSPLSRALTTGGTLADPRKWQDPYAIPLNLATGLKVSDVDMAKQRNISEREFVSEMLRGKPEVGRFETMYLKPGMGANLDPEEMLLLRLNATLEKRAQEAAKQKKIRVGG